MTHVNDTPGVELQGLEKSFRTPHGTVEAVRGVDISIRAGEIVALLGPNGAGKSTTIDMLLGLAQPDTGSVSVLGRSPEEATLAGMIGAMLQTGSRATRRCSCSTSRPPRWTSRDAMPSGARCASSPRAAARSAPRCPASRFPSSSACPAIRALLAAHPEARDIEIASAGLEQAFLELTASTS
jgi:hypothetical protein